MSVARRCIVEMFVLRAVCVIGQCMVDRNSPVIKIRLYMKLAIFVVRGTNHGYSPI